MTRLELQTHNAIQSIPMAVDRLALAQEQANKIAIHDARHADRLALLGDHVFRTHFNHRVTCGQEDCPVCGVTR